MSYLDKVTVGSTTYDIQDTKAQGDIVDLKSASKALETSTVKAYDYKVGGTVKFMISPSTGKWATQSGYRSYYFDRPAGAKILCVRANANANCGLALLSSSDTMTSGSLPSYATGETGRRTITAGTEEFILIPDDCAHIYVYDRSTSSDTVNTPAFFGFNPVADSHPGVQPADLAFNVGREPGFINYTNGAVGTSDYTTATDFIDLTGITEIVYTRMKLTSSSSTYGLAFYDANKDFISDSGISSVRNQKKTEYYMYRAAVPSTAQYVRLSAVRSIGPVSLYNAEDYDATMEGRLAKVESDYNPLNTGLDILSAFSNIMCCGDSLTASVVYTADTSVDNHARAAYRRYPDILATKTGANVTYKALGGYCASEWWDAYKNYITQQENQLAIIYLGTNKGSTDTLGLTDTVDTDAEGDDPAYYESNNTGSYSKIIKTFQLAGARVLLVHVCERVDQYEDINLAMDHIADRFGCAVVDVPYLSDAKYHSYPDGTGVNPLHYNDLGYAAWTDSLIRQVGELPTDMMKRIIPI